MRLRDSHVPPTPRSSPAPDAPSLAGADASPAVDAVAGAAGALLALLSTYPLMTLNTRQHTERGADETLPRRRGGINTHTHTRRRVSMMDELRAVAKEDGGLAGLYRGIEPAVIGTVTSQTVYNYVYASLRVAMARKKKKKRRRGPRRAGVARDRLRRGLDQRRADDPDMDGVRAHAG